MCVQFKKTLAAELNLVDLWSIHVFPYVTGMLIIFCVIHFLLAQGWLVHAGGY